MVIINCQLSIINYFIERCHQLGNDERLSFHFVELVRGEVVYLHAQITCELSEVLFGNYHLLVLLQDSFRVLGERVQISEVGEGHLLACLVHLFHGRIQVAVCTAETDNQQVGIVCATLHFYIGYGDLATFSARRRHIRLWFPGRWRWHRYCCPSPDRRGCAYSPLVREWPSSGHPFRDCACTAYSCPSFRE